MRQNMLEASMKECPILFSAPMVRAILEERKMQTRRIDGLRIFNEQPNRWKLEGDMFAFDGGFEYTKVPQCPKGQPGDRLWVRENGWERPERTPTMMREGADTWKPYYYDADGYNNDHDKEQFKGWGFKRRPSIHMPRWASRILLEIVSVRIERLLDIDDEGALAEGVSQQMLSQFGYTAEVSEETFNTTQARKTFRFLWESINGYGSWSTNPWVWVIEFKRVAQ